MMTDGLSTIEDPVGDLPEFEGTGQPRRILRTVSEIAAHLGEDERRVYRLLESNLLPGWKRGNIWETTPEALDADVERRAVEALARCQK